MSRRQIGKIVPLIIFVLILIPLGAVAYGEAGQILGLRPIPVSVAGTGSMYPSLYWSVVENGPEDPDSSLIPEYRTSPHLYYRFPGITISGRTFLRRPIGFGDIVAFRSRVTEQILQKEGKDGSDGFIKRVIGLPGDTLELRDGFVYRNGAPINEPYLHAPRSTYGQSFLTDCHPLTIPPDFYFVMGDNRKVSSDSRGELGLVSEQTITHILPFAHQQQYHTLYRDTSADSKLALTPTLDTSEFVTLLNQTRNKSGKSPLKLSTTLTKSATAQAANILSSKPESLGSVTAKFGYHNIILAEFSSFGSYSAPELLANLLSQYSTFSQINSSEYQDIGLGVVNRQVDNCPRQVIVGQLGGYVPPQYDDELRSSWQKLANNLSEIIPSWEQAKAYPQLDSSQLSQLLSILERRHNLAKEVLSNIDSLQWFSEDLKTRIDRDSIDAQEAERLINQLNSSN